MTWLVPTDTAASPGVVLLVPVERGEVVVIDAGVFELVGTGPVVLNDGTLNLRSGRKWRPAGSPDAAEGACKHE